MFERLLTFDPITTGSLFYLFTLYIQYLILSILGSVVAYVLFKQKLDDVKFSLRLVVLASISEELIFRGLPLWIGGKPFMIGATILWSLFHLNITSIMGVIFHGIFYSRLWLGGLWYWACFFHLFHNLWIIGLSGRFKKNE